MTSKIEQQVMASVGMIYVVRRLTSATALKLYVSVAALWGLGQLVWVQRVFENWANVGASGTLDFLVSALLNTDLAVQFVLVALAVVGVSLVRDMARLQAPMGRFAA